VVQYPASTKPGSPIQQVDSIPVNWAKTVYFPRT
jgi:hypothetical protein